MRRLSVLGALGVVILAIIGTLLIWPDKSTKTNNINDIPKNKFQSAEHTISFEYSAEAKEIKLTEQDQKDKFIFRAGKESDKQYLVTLRFEDGLRVAANVSKTDTIDLVLDGANKAYPTRYPKYKKISERKFQINGKEASEVIFKYEGPSGESVKQKLLILVKDEDKAYYLTMQSKDLDYEELNTKVFELISQSLSF